MKNRPLVSLSLSLLLSPFVFVALYRGWFRWLSLEEENYNSERTIGEYVLSMGYRFEEHKVLTSDGYILSLWHIPGLLSLPYPKNKSPVLIMHGFFDSASSWLVKEGEANLPLLLAKEGYDVWLGNSRGNIYSLEHLDKKYHKWEKMRGKFWEFSFDEMAEWDIPATVDYILDITGFDSLHYVGHSQGSLQLLLAATNKLDWVNSHIKSLVVMAPPLFTAESEVTGFNLVEKTGFIQMLNWLGIGNLWSAPGLRDFSGWVGRLCPRLIADMIPFIISAPNSFSLPTERIPFFAKTQPGGASTQTALHWLQTKGRGQPAKYNFGDERNEEKYGRMDVEEYAIDKLKNLTFPVQGYVGSGDALIFHPETLSRLVSTLPPQTDWKIVKDYSHMDYILASDADDEIYFPLLDFFNRIQTNSQSEKQIDIREAKQNAYILIEQKGTQDLEMKPTF